jgi:hypothetical protein
MIGTGSIHSLKLSGEADNIRKLFSIRQHSLTQGLTVVRRQTRLLPQPETGKIHGVWQARRPKHEQPYAYARHHQPLAFDERLNAPGA